MKQTITPEYRQELASKLRDLHTKLDIENNKGLAWSKAIALEERIADFQDLNGDIQDAELLLSRHGVTLQSKPEKKHFVETHIFSTGVDDPAFINVSRSIDSHDLADAKVQAGEARCSLSVRLGALSLIRNGVEYSLVEGDITVDSIPGAVRDRLAAAGCPISTADPDISQKAIAGLVDGSMIVRGSELVRGKFDFESLNNENFCSLLNGADHISYGIH